MLTSKSPMFLFSAIVIALRFYSWMELSDRIQQENTLLLVGILSAQNNSEARASIRHTWKSLITNKDIKFYFVVGMHTCPIHPVDRKSTLSCDPLELQKDSAFQKELWTPQILNQKKQPVKSVVTSFTFRTNFPVIVRGIRIWRGAVPSNASFAVSLKNANTGSEITSVPHTSFGITSGNDIWMEAHQIPFLIPKSFDSEVQFIIEPIQDEINSMDTSVFCYGHSMWFNFSGAVEFTTQFGTDSGWTIFDEDSCSPVSLLLDLHDVHSHLQEKNLRNQQWQRDMTLLSKTLKHEAESLKDIVFVDVLDVYRNIPKKLLKFYQWANQSSNFSFIMKADDDTFIDIPIIQTYLKFLVSTPETKLQSQMWWWGRLRHGLPVERHGKWQELQYAAPVYPPFPCGGGYIINKNIVDFLVSNSKWLNPFQGEDTSLGIWLSGVHPTAPRNAPCHWTCGLECKSPSCIRGQLSPGNMIGVWHQYQESQRLC